MLTAELGCWVWVGPHVLACGVCSLGGVFIVCVTAAWVMGAAWAWQVRADEMVAGVVGFAACVDSGTDCLHGLGLVWLGDMGACGLVVCAWA